MIPLRRMLQIMELLTQSIEQIEQEFAITLKAVSTDQELEAVRITFLSRNGRMAALMKELKKLSTEEKRTIGPLLNQLKSNAENAFNMQKETLLYADVQKAAEAKKYFDVTASPFCKKTGRLHIYSQVIDELNDIFISMGFDIADGPEVETDFYNFEALNIPQNHPARDMHDTFWVSSPHHLLRTHTSTIQIHAMQNQSAPLALFAPGRCYRHEATDASHDFMFMQAEGLFIDKNISVSHLLATAKTFIQKIFCDKNLKIRVRPGYFPFVEPGLEIDVSCPFCKNGCSVCKKTQWIELLGGGLVHPNVLKHGSFDPDIYSGFAFGFGLERLIMIRHGINDIRYFHGNELEFLKQF